MKNYWQIVKQILIQSCKYGNPPYEVGEVPPNIYMESQNRDRLIDEVKNGQVKGLEIRTGKF